MMQHEQVIHAASKGIHRRVAAKIAQVRQAIGTAPYGGQEVIGNGEVARYRTVLYLVGDDEAKERYADLELIRVFGEVNGKELIQVINEEHRRNQS